MGVGPAEAEPIVGDDRLARGGGELGGEIPPQLDAAEGVVSRTTGASSADRPCCSRLQVRAKSRPWRVSMKRSREWMWVGTVTSIAQGTAARAAEVVAGDSTEKAVVLTILSLRWHSIGASL
jgi:hypothetical protein